MKKFYKILISQGQSIRMFSALSEMTFVIRKIATIQHADESPTYNNLLVNYDLQQVNHKKEYRSDAITNSLVENYFSGFKRMYYSQVHLMSNEVAYGEDTRRQSNGDIFEDILEKCLVTFNENNWKGYWQGY